jgi:PhoPQ-activated pathogenicity-related protein
MHFNPGRRIRLLAVIGVFVPAVTSLSALAGDAPIATAALDAYVAKEDASYQWRKTREGKLGTADYAELILTSQTWRDIVWKHQLHVIRPQSTPVDCKHALLFITGGRWRDELQNPTGEFQAPTEAQIFSSIAEQLKSPIAILQHVPFQPIFGGMVEDEIISMTFEQFMRTGDAEWPLLLPMVKSAVRGMDATQEYCREQWSLNIEDFTVTGASKRGWTTWLTGAVDPRATAIAPMVIDTLNMGPQMKHQLFSWGKYSEQIRDYTERGIQQHIDTPVGDALRAIVDPYSYRERLNQPKLLIMGTNDRYWPLDALNLYWDDLGGEKYILYVPNQGHSIRDFPRVLGSLAALHRHATGEKPLPKLEWEFQERDGTPGALRLAVNSDETPERVNIWLAKSDTRDFRDSRWESTEATKNGEGWEYTLEVPEQGYAAIFGESVYGGGPAPLYLSTNVRIVHNGDDEAGGQ